MTADISALAPAGPPCFNTRLQWVEYLQAAQAESDGTREAPFNRAGEFNAAFNFCADCNSTYRLSMLLEGRCKPRCLRTTQPQQGAASAEN